MRGPRRNGRSLLEVRTHRAGQARESGVTDAQAGCAVVAVLAAALFVLGGEGKAPGGWITGAPDDAARFERIERYLRGYDQPMTPPAGSR